MNSLSPFLKPACLLGLAVFLAAGCATYRAPRPSTLNAFRTQELDPAVQTRVEELRPLTVSDLTHALDQGVPEQAVLDYVKDTRSVYRLETADVDRLRAANASDELINSLLATPEQSGNRRNYYYSRRYYYHRPYHYGRFGRHHYGRHHYGYRPYRYYGYGCY